MSLLSVVIPAYNEGAMIHKTAEVVSSLLSENNIEYEIIFVNDGSKDTTWEEIVNKFSGTPHTFHLYPALSPTFSSLPKTFLCFHSHLQYQIQIHQP